MKAEVRAKWVEALRSGKYKQGRERLRRGDTFCCLGVLCDLINPSGWQNDGAGFVYARCVAFPPPEVSKASELSMNDEVEVATLNDDGKSFAEIADYIEANL